MFKTLFKNKKAQNTAEYALLIALVVAGIIAMQTYAQRALQARVRGASILLTNSASVNAIGRTIQYEPYYQQTNYVVDRTSTEDTILNNSQMGGTRKNADVDRSRAKDGFTTSTYNTAIGLWNGI